MPDLNDLTNEAANLARDAVYVAVGLGVLGSSGPRCSASSSVTGWPATAASRTCWPRPAPRSTPA